MIRKAQIKFICITMSLLLCVFCVIFGLVYVSMRDVNERAIEHTLNDIRGGFMFSNEVLSDSAFVAIIIPSNIDNEIQIITSENSLLKQEQINHIVKKAMINSYNSGSINNIYYKLTRNQNIYTIVGADVSEMLASFRSGILSSTTILLLIYLVLALIVVALSFSVFQPIKESFYKQKQFIANASHELKTPLAIISANAEVLKQNQSNVWIDNINSQTQRMENLIQDLLAIAKMDEGKVKLSIISFNLSEIITNTALPFDAVAYEKHKNLNIAIQPDIQYKGDINSVKNIVNILIDNAIKHASYGGEISVTLKKENSKISLTVFNTGSNISEHEVNKVFERFYRGENSRSRESGGSGLGLSIAKGIADTNKWKISAKSKLDEFMSITIFF